MCCNGYVPVAFLVISLITTRFILKQRTNKRKETIMEHVNKLYEKLKIGIKSMIETIWAIGTSVAATGVLH
jgi:hypothetical protein